MEKIYIKTFGCSLNCSDSEVMAGILKKTGFHIVDDPEKADLVIINTCTVKGPTENKFYRFLKSITKPIVIAGCIAQTDPEKLQGYSLIGPGQLEHIVEVVEESLNGYQITMLVNEKTKRLGLPKVRKSMFIGIIPICSGCLGEPCAYCKVKSARGELVSYPRYQIVEEAKEAIADGVKELWLTAQDTGCWGKEINDSLPNLLKDICSLKGDFMVRLGMANPNHVKEIQSELIESYKHPKMYKFLHIPVQSGNDDILKAMRRKYTVDDFRNIVKAFRKEIPMMTIATDIICGFPGESKQQFTDSIELVKELKPDVLNRSRFWPRPKTEAAEMKGQLVSRDTKERSRELASIFSWVAFDRNKEWERWEGEIFIDEKGTDDKGLSWVGRNFAYKPVVVFSKDDLLGKKVRVKVKQVTPHDLRALIIS